MTDDDIDEVLDIWKEIGLYEGKHSIQTFKAIDPNAFYVAVLDDGKCCLDYPIVVINLWNSLWMPFLFKIILLKSFLSGQFSMCLLEEIIKSVY